MAGIRTWAEFRIVMTASARENRTGFILGVWAAILTVPMLISIALMLSGFFPQWLGIVAGVLVVLYSPATLYWKLRDRRNIGVKRRAYRRAPLEDHETTAGLLRAVSWRWGVVAVSAALTLLTAATGAYFLAHPSNPFVWALAFILLACIALSVLSHAVVRSPLAYRSLMRLHAGVEAEHPNKTFVIFKSAQVSSEIALADTSSKLGLWNDNSFRVVVSFDDENIRIWDQIWGTRHNVATIPWSRVAGIELAIARVRWRFVRAIDLRLYSEPGEPQVGIVLPPARCRWGFHPLPDADFEALSMQLKTQLARRRGRAASLEG